MAYLRLLYRFPWFLLHLLIGTPITVLLQYPFGQRIRLGGRPLAETTLRAWGWMTCRIFGLRIRADGAFPPGAQLVAANHISWIDIPLLHSQSQLGFVAKAEIQGWPVIGYMARVGGTVFHRRGSHDSASGVAAVMGERLREGGKVAIFPEGGILPGHGIKRFHGRMFAAAIETGVPVQPVMVRYLRQGEYARDITFLPGEHFVGNFFRLMRQPPCIAEVAILPAIDPAGMQRRPLASAAESAVRAAFEAGLENA
jgi:1-acyl-sn-glycerol-3-phosphate acyltransferase